ncbi:hypothetical protein TNCT_485121 [Trichonephila clavata]|uniref:Uncharacterized protein n=1 Tax=Trichonephila clavata TaxID=2740835 RepID=A0A8X6FDY6_TRICU|nr:hypothetical protein TNCT_485121 [Trichonephila clavata]
MPTVLKGKPISPNANWKNPSWNTQLSVASVVATSRDAISPSEIGQALRKTYRRMYLRQIIPKRCLAARKAAERLKNKTAENKIWPRAQKKREWSPSVRTGPRRKGC